MSNCKHCKQELVSIPWNMNGNIMVCDTVGCLMFHTPQGFDSRNYSTMGSVNKKGGERHDSFGLSWKSLRHTPEIDGYSG